MSDWPVYSNEEIEAVAGVLRSGKVNAWTGSDVAAFEAEYRDYLGSGHAIAMANGSLTLDTALRVLGVKPGDEVIVTPRSFVASASTVLLAGGIPVFADIDPDSQNITPQTIAPHITPRTVGILPVHLAGWPCDMDGILDLARANNLWVVEDCAQAHGAMIGRRHVGTMGDFGSYSFCQDKIISTGGEGGLLVTDNEELWSRAWSFKDHGKGHATVFAKTHQPGFRWLHDSDPGTNLRMTGLSAAIGRIQLSRLDETRAYRTRNSKILAGILSQSSALRVPLPPEDLTHAYYRFYAFVRPEAMAGNWSRDRILDEIAAAGFPALSGSCSEVYREAIFRDRGLGPDQPLAVARQLGETSLAFLVDTTWTEERLVQLAECALKIANRSLSA